MSKIRSISVSLQIILACFFCSALCAAVPSDYYDSVDASNAEALKNSLHQIIDDHTRFPYTSSAVDTWDILEQADSDPSADQNVLDVYKNASYAKAGGGNAFYNREHSWPKSYGFPDDGNANYPYTDAHHLFIADSSYNSSRNNKPFDACVSLCDEKPTDFNNSLGGSATQSNWTKGQGAMEGAWEVWAGRRGDIARALFYMDVRYEGGKHSRTDVEEPNLELTDDRALIAASNTGNNQSVAYMGLKSVLLQWHLDDPVSAEELRRNDVIFSYQGNRNPFIDHPEYVACVFQNNCAELGTGIGDSGAPNAPSGLTLTVNNLEVNLRWIASEDTSVIGYHVYRSTPNHDEPLRLNQALLTTAEFTDILSDRTEEVTYYITAENSQGMESPASSSRVVPAAELSAGSMDLFLALCLLFPTFLVRFTSRKTVQ